MVTIRHAEASDHARVSPHLDAWWGGRSMRAMLPRLFFEHFRDASFVAEDEGKVVGFLCGFLSQTFPDQAYVHFVGVQPDRRVTQVNVPSVAFHQRLGFEIEAEVPDYDGGGEARVLLRKQLL